MFWKGRKAYVLAIKALFVCVMQHNGSVSRQGGSDWVLIAGNNRGTMGEDYNQRFLSPDTANRQTSNGYIHTVFLISKCKKNGKRKHIKKCNFSFLQKRYNIDQYLNTF